MAIKISLFMSLASFSVVAFADGAMDNAVAQFQYQKCISQAQAAVPCQNIPRGEDSTQYSECMAKSNGGPDITGALADCKKKLEAATKPVAAAPPADPAPQGEKMGANTRGDVVNPDDNQDESPALQVAVKRSAAKPVNNSVDDSGGDGPSSPTPPQRPSNLSSQNNTPSSAPAASSKSSGGDTSSNDKSTPQASNSGDKGTPSNSTPSDKSSTTDSSKSSPTDSSGDAQASADADLASCTNLQSTANQCCNNPMSCAGSMSYGQDNLASVAQQMSDGPSPGQSINDYCTQMNNAGASSGAVNNGLGAICESKLTTCSVTCQSLAQKYQRLSANCGDGCDNSSIYQNAYSSLMAQVSTCKALDAQGSQMVNQGASNNQGTAYSSLCAQNSAQQPAASMGNLANTIPNSAMQTNAGGSIVNQQPQSTGCQTSANSDACTRGGSTAQQSTLGYSNGAPTGGSTDVGNLRDRMVGMDPSLAAGSRVEPSQVAAGIVPSNGGGFGGSVDGFKPLAAGASAPNARVGGMVGPMANGGDIMHGLRSGPAGASPGSSVIPEQAGAATQAANRAVASASSGGFKAFSLRDYLPGFARDPHRGLANANADILGRGEDIFNHISAKMTEKCRLQVLYGCGG